MQVNTARASGALSVIPGCLQEYRRESINVLGNVLITVDQLRELNEESGMVEMPELPEFSHHAGIDVSDATLPPQMLHVDQCGCATNLPRIYVSIVPFAEDSSQATLVVPHAGALVYGIYKRLVLLRSKFKTYVAACYSKLCSYFPKHPTMSELQTMTWGYLVGKLC